ncbi:uncharacterized protein LOC132189046 isoform X2 [Corylus avellana]|uniref:uncharacterized protein LOC132189046 isoform X2 n=1 Tax=Corylus avellana TaxID=13451 RepID=UPI00286A0443|nr:uncharacterized protein LOC132189046 isoform X2 [Corylus avellana]
MGSGRWWGLVVIGAVVAVVASGASQKKHDPLVSRIAFGSCSDQSHPQPIWNALINFDPQVFIWLGDNIYGDIKRPFKVFGKERTFGPWKNAPRFVPSSSQEMEFKYKKARTNPGYSRLRERTKVIGTWDDHDYGLNDAGKEFSGKINNQRLLLDFLDEPQDSPRRKQDGVYASYTFGPVGRQVKVISNLSAATGPLFSFESWGRFPKERDHLFKLIADSKRDGVFFISGDVHFGEITRYDCATGYPLYDITSSGLTKAVEETVPPALHRIIRFVARLTPSPLRVMDQNCRYSSCTYGQPNFGAIEIDWDATPMTLKIEVRDVNGLTVSGVKMSLLELQVGSLDPVATAKAGEHRRHCSLEVDLPWLVRYRLAILFYSAVAICLLALIGFTYAAISIVGRCLRKHKYD